jgi:hypothetical protein
LELGTLQKLGTWNSGTWNFLSGGYRLRGVLHEAAAKPDDTKAQKVKIIAATLMREPICIERDSRWYDEGRI